MDITIGNILAFVIILFAINGVGNKGLRCKPINLNLIVSMFLVQILQLII